MQVNEMAKDYLFYCSFERLLSHNTISAYRSDLESFVDFVIKRKDAGKLDVDVIRSYLAYMVDRVHLSASTIRRRVACLKGFFKFAAERHDFENPFRDWSPILKRPRRLPRAISCSDVHALIDSTESLSKIHSETIFAVLAIISTGVRVSELCAMRVKDVSVDGEAIHIRGKGARDRIVYVSDEELRANFANRRERRLLLQGEGAPLIVNSRGKNLRPQTLRRRLHSLSKSRRVQRTVTPHTLRHTAATLLIESGIDIRFVQRLLGHASIATTEIYTQVTDCSLRRVLTEANTVRMVSNMP